MRSLALAALLTFALAGCAGGDDSDSTGTDADESRSASVEVVEAGFGQDPDSLQYVRAAAVVQANADAAGYFVIVSMNFLDEAGETIVTEQQTESISWPDQKSIIPVFLDLGSDDVVVSSVEATVSLSNDGGGTGEPIPDVTATEVSEGEFGGTEAKFTFANPLEEDLTDARVGVLCRDEAGEIVGGTSHYPSLIPAGAEIVTVVDVTTSVAPESCEATINHG